MPRALVVDPGDRSELLAAFHRQDLLRARALAESRAAALPDDWESQNDLGAVLLGLGDGAGAERALRAALAADPGRADTWYNLASLMHRRGDRTAAAELYREAIVLDSNHAQAHRDYAMLELAHGVISPEVWEAFRRRRDCDGFVRSVAAPGIPEWRGEALAGRTIYVYGEQGLGDEILYASCYPDLIAAAGCCVIGAEPRLVELFRRSFPQALVVDRTRPAELAAVVGPIEYQIPSGDLLGRFRPEPEAFSSRSAYLRADAHRVARWRDRLQTLGSGLKVGLSWRGGTPRSGRAIRSIAPAELAPLVCTSRAVFVSLQYGDCAADLTAINAATGMQVPHWQEAIDDYDETAALVSALDMVVSVATSVVHLSCALGRPTLILVHPTPRWCYRAAGSSTPWHPTARILRQAKRGVWTDVLMAAREIVDGAGDRLSPTPSAQ